MSLYLVVRIIGTSANSWEEAAKSALEEAARHLEDLRVAEVEQLDLRLQENKVVEYRARVRASFRYHPEKTTSLPEGVLSAAKRTLGAAARRLRGGCRRSGVSTAACKAREMIGDARLRAGHRPADPAP